MKNTGDLDGESLADEEAPSREELTPSGLKQLRDKVNSSNRRGAASHPVDDYAKYNSQNQKDQELKKKQLFSNMGSIQVIDGADDLYREETSEIFNDSGPQSN